MAQRPSLDLLARAHGTDKSSYRHGFADIYERYLSPLRDHVVTVLEIGVYEGASLRMWRDYFPAGRIVGVDVREDAEQHREERIRIHVGDQSDPDFLTRLAHTDGPFDVVVDDGGHRAEQQLASITTLWPHLRPGGIYAVEDVQTSYLERWGGGWHSPGTTVEFLKQLVDDMHVVVHNQPVVLPGIAEMHFHYELCVVRRVGTWKAHASPQDDGPERAGEPA